MEYTENTIPPECEACKEEDCYNCDTAGKRWVLSSRSELELQKKLALQAIERYQRKIDRIDRMLSATKQR